MLGSLPTQLAQKALFQKLADLAPKLRQIGVLSLSVFGSRARGEAEISSDLDVLVVMDEALRPSLLDLIAVKHSLEDELGLKVDVSERDSLHFMLRDRIEAESVKVF